MKFVVASHIVIISECLDLNILFHFIFDHSRATPPALDGGHSQVVSQSPVLGVEGVHSLHELDASSHSQHLLIILSSIKFPLMHFSYSLMYPFHLLSLLRPPRVACWCD